MEVNRVRMASFLLGGLAGAALAISMQRSGKFAGVTSSLGKSLIGLSSARQDIGKMVEDALK